MPPEPPTPPEPPKPPAKMPPAEEPPAQPKPPVGAFGEAFFQKLKTASPGTSDEAVVMEMIRTMPADQLKAALATGTSKERSQLFSAIPGDQIKSILESLPASVLAPAKPPGLAPSPTGGPPASILQTTHENMEYPPAQTDPNWSTKISDGHTPSLTHPFQREWVSVYKPGSEKEGSLENPMVGLTGWVVNPTLSQGDVWFVHPFGFDFEFYIVPDPPYESLLAASNTGVTPGTGDKNEDYIEATKQARNLGLAAPKGVIGVEIDQDLVPRSFQNLITDGTRIAAFGRWIVDCGHPDFHTEIHPPLLMAVAKPVPPPASVQGASDVTSVQIMSRPYTVSEEFDEGNFVAHLLAEVAKVQTTIFGIPFSTRVEAHPTVFRTPYDKRPFVKLLVQPPPRKDVSSRQRLMVSFHFTHRAGVAVQVFDAGNDTVGIIIVLGDLNPAPLPRKHDHTVSWDQLKGVYPFVIGALEIEDILTLNIASALILNRGILTDLYDPPSASSPLDNQNVAAPVDIDQLRPGAGISEDDRQPFPIYGWLNVWWQPVTDLITYTGRVTFLRAHDTGTAFGEPPNQLDVEVVLQLDDAPGKSFGFQLRDDAEEPTRREMLDLLRSAFTQNRAVTIDVLQTVPQVGVVIRVALQD
jgi:hypothetical protein